MTPRAKHFLLFGAMALLLIMVGTLQSWNVALTILNLCLISAIMTLGVNIQWGYAGLFNAGVMGFTALGGLAAIIVSVPPVPEAWQAGGSRTMLGLCFGGISIGIAVVTWLKTANWGKAATG